MSDSYHQAVQEAVDAATMAEGDREQSEVRGTLRAHHRRGKIVRMLTRFLENLPDDMLVMEIRDGLEE